MYQHRFTVFGGKRTRYGTGAEGGPRLRGQRALVDAPEGAICRHRETMAENTACAVALTRDGTGGMVRGVHLEGPRLWDHRADVDVRLFSGG